MSSEVNNNNDADINVDGQASKKAKIDHGGSNGGIVSYPDVQQLREVSGVLSNKLIEDQQREIRALRAELEDLKKVKITGRHGTPVYAWGNAYDHGCPVAIHRSYLYHTPSHLRVLDGGKIGNIQVQMMEFPTPLPISNLAEIEVHIGRTRIAVPISARRGHVPRRETNENRLNTRLDGTDLCFDGIDFDVLTIHFRDDDVDEDDVDERTLSIDFFIACANDDRNVEKLPRVYADLCNHFPSNIPLTRENVRFFRDDEIVTFSAVYVPVCYLTDIPTNRSDHGVQKYIAHDIALEAVRTGYRRSTEKAYSPEEEKMVEDDSGDGDYYQYISSATMAQISKRALSVRDVLMEEGISDALFRDLELPESPEISVQEQVSKIVDKLTPTVEDSVETSEEAFIERIKQALLKED